MMPGSKGRAFHARMKKHDFETRKNMRKSHFSQKNERFRMFLEFRGAERPVDVRLAPTVAVAKTTKCGEIRGIMGSKYLLTPTSY